MSVTQLVKKKTVAYQEKSLITFFIFLQRTKTIKVIFFSVWIEQPSSLTSVSSLSFSQSHLRLIVFHLKDASYAFLCLFFMLRVSTNDRFTIIYRTISLDHCQLFVNFIGLMQCFSTTSVPWVIVRCAVENDPISPNWSKKIFKCTFYLKDEI